jgi:chromate transport protein ChrA
MLATGLHMWHEHGYDPVGWLVVKVVCWLGLSALAGIGYRRRGKTGLLIAVALFLIVTAVTMVYLKPF